MKPFITRGLQFCIALWTMSFANPIPPLPPLSEIQVIDNNHWTVEVECKNSQYSIVHGPCSTDTFTLFCGQQNIWPPIDSMQICLMPELFDSNGIALLTPKQFPNLKIINGCNVFLGLKGQSAPISEAQIPATLLPTSSIISAYDVTCGMMGDGSCYEYYTSIKYVTSNCPSIGISNASAIGNISGQIIGSDSLPLRDVKVNSTNTLSACTTDYAGHYLIYGLDSCHTYSLRFSDRKGNLISDTVIGPLSIIMGRTLTVNVKLNYKIPTNIISTPKINISKNKIRFLQTGMGQRIVLSVMQTVSGKGTIEIFSTNGKCIRSLPFDLDKSGTYTIAWDGCNDRHVPVASGKYGCRIQINGETVCSGFIIK